MTSVTDGSRQLSRIGKASWNMEISKMRRVAIVGLGITWWCGCSGPGAAFEAAKVGLRLSKKSTHLRISLDGHLAEENTLKKAATGESNWKIKDGVSTSPRLMFTIENPEKFGRITQVVASFYQQFEADYSHQPDFTISSTSNDPAAQMKPGDTYDLAAPPSHLRVTNLTGQSVGRVDLRPGMKYKLILVVRADRSESGMIEFKTN